MLDNYQAILQNRRLAAHLITKRVAVPCDNFSNLNEEELWTIHDKSLRKYRELKDKPPKEADRKPYPECSLLDIKIELARRILKNCHFCERRCGVDRLEGELGFCKVGKNSYYSSEFLHLGEEPELVPSHTIFFSGCTFHCCYCQNFDIATHPKSGRVVSSDEMAKIITLRYKEGSKNVNFVGGNPDPNLYTIFKIVKKVDLNLPLIWNSNMYTSKEAMAILEGLIDVFLGDFRYGNDECAKKYSDVSNYFEVVSRNFKIAYRQAEVILRHLVLPGHLRCCSRKIMEWVKENIPQVYFNLMFQYHPCYRAGLFPELNRLLTLDEKQSAIKFAQKLEIKV